jgi:hypothetical protein
MNVVFVPHPHPLKQNAAAPQFPLNETGVPSGKVVSAKHEVVPKAGPQEFAEARLTIENL